MRLSILFLIPFVFYLTACQKEHEPTPRPFKGTVLEMQADEVDPDCECEEDDTIFGLEGTGNLTPMGNVTSETTVCIESFIFDDDGNIIGSNENGVCVRLIAANGDELIVEGGPHSLLFDPACLCVKGEFTVQFTGGTGRFENATGSANLAIAFDPATEIYTEEYNGEISY